jgi:hypothetical protein
MAWGVGSCFVAEAPPGVAQPAVVFAARDREDTRHWRAVAADGSILDDRLDLLRLADPGDAPRAETPEDLDLDRLWQVAVDDICAKHNAQLDPAAAEQRLPASQRWALDLLRDPSLPPRDELERADAALSVARDPIVRRRLSEVRRQHGDSALTAIAAADRVLAVVEEFGLRPPKPRERPPRELQPDDVGVVVYQVIRPPDASGAEV